MSLRRSSRVTVFSAVAALTVIAVATMSSWACVPQPLLVLLPNSTVPPGGDVIVSGQYFLATQVEVRWNSVDGSLLGVAGGPIFSSQVRIPDVADGLYTVVAFSRDPTAGVGAIARAEVEVRSPALPAEGGTGDAGERSVTSRSTLPRYQGVFDGGALVLIGGVIAALFVGRRRHGDDVSAAKSDAVMVGGD